jgi:gluconolactonase
MTIKITQRTLFAVTFILLLLTAGITCSFAQSPVPSSAVVEKISTGYAFVEGPVWSDSLGLLFSDMNGNKIIRWTQADGASVFMNPSSNANGLTFDKNKKLLMNQCGLRRVARLDSGGVQTPLATTFRGKKLNSPNDIVVKSDGAIFFTDPPFNIPTGQSQELPFSGIYRINRAGTLQLLDSTLSLPNGICFSPDESKLYVNESQQRIIYVWDVVNDSVISNRRTFASIPVTGYADGMKIDSAGNLFCAGPRGIWVYSPAGVILDTILVTETPSNCNWGGADRKTLFITAQTSLYRIRLSTTGVKEESSELPTGFQLMQNYPNPFNPSTWIVYSVPSVGGGQSATGRVKLAVYDLLGREIDILVNENKAPGTYRVRWEPTGRASGAYYYRLTAGDFSETRTMLFEK